MPKSIVDKLVGRPKPHPLKSLLAKNKINQVYAARILGQHQCKFNQCLNGWKEFPPSIADDVDRLVKELTKKLENKRRNLDPVEKLMLSNKEMYIQEMKKKIEAEGDWVKEQEIRLVKEKKEKLEREYEERLKMLEEDV